MTFIVFSPLLIQVYCVGRFRFLLIGLERHKPFHHHRLFGFCWGIKQDVQFDHG